VSLVGFKGQNHPQQVGQRGAKPNVDDRQTDPGLFHVLNRRFRFTVDVVASAENAQCDRFYTVAENGLEQSWAGERVWCNPPYSDIEPWIIKAHAEAAELVVMLLPANRTEQGWWQRQVEPYRDRSDRFRVEFLPGRLRFIQPGAIRVGANERPPFGCCLLIWSRRGTYQ
jgi:phage N-6-adenine-methyltransferase